MNRSALITGASTGIGEACALHLAGLGWQVFAGVRKTSDGEALQAKSGRVIPVVVDVTNEASIARIAKEVEAITPGLAGLVNNAGIAVAGPLEFLPLDEIRRQLEVNVIGQIAVVQAFMPLLRAAKGRIVNMSSISGKVAAPLFAPYAASKFALEAISDSLRRELAPWGLEVCIIEPGNINTPIWDKGVTWGQDMMAKLPPKAQELYRPNLERLITYISGNLGKGAAPLEVANAVEHALSAPRPKTRYVVGSDARLGILLSRILPDRWVDGFILGRRKQQVGG
jgi:NAD(P)-dependent dehydrogenase (short-subunit alcohol dehydrogenase family)